MGHTTTYLVDLQGRVVHSWKSAFASSGAVELLPNGHLLRSTVDPLSKRFRSGGRAGRLEELDWDGTVVWSFTFSSEVVRQHHDFAVLPSGNLLFVAWERKSAEEAIRAGRDPESLRGGELWSDFVVEIEPIAPDSANVVWEWHLWDHLIQGDYPARENFGSVADFQRRFDLNASRYEEREEEENEWARLRALGYVDDEGAPDTSEQSSAAAQRHLADWIHTNAIDYDPQSGCIVLTARNPSELWVIEHGTTRGEARSSSGGNYGNGGDFVARWGRNENFDPSLRGDRMLYFPHDAHWIAPDLPGAGNLLVFNNGPLGAEQRSQILELRLPTPERAGGCDPGAGELVWTLDRIDGRPFFSSHISGAQRLPNGNTLVCLGVQRRVVELDPAGETVWDYGSSLHQSPSPAHRAGQSIAEGQRARSGGGGPLPCKASRLGLPRTPALGPARAGERRTIGVTAMDPAGGSASYPGAMPTPPIRTPLASVLLAQAIAAQHPSDWPQGPGPHGNWSAQGPAPPLRFSVRSGENIVWRQAMPETGQGGITIHGGRVFVACMAPWDPKQALSAEEAELYAHATEKRTVVGKHIDALCLAAESGEVLWKRRIEGEVPAIYSYPFSDATSASPVTDGVHVWFTNASGQVACFTTEGDPVWQHRFTPTFDGPFNKQFEPFLVLDESGDEPRKVLVHMEPFGAAGQEQGELSGRWHYLVGLDAATGEVLWRSDDALTHYSAPTLIATPHGPGILHARGGPHEVPERPVGVSLTRLVGPDAGKALWRYEDPRGNHEASLQTMAYDERHVYWLLKEPHDMLVVLDRESGRELREVSLRSAVTRTSFDPQSGRWVTRTGVDLDKGVFPARYSMIAANGKLFFQCYNTAFEKPTIGPAYSFARVDPTEGGGVEYLEVPTGVVRAAGTPEAFLWRTPRSARPLNSKGVEVTGDDRCRWDGWDWVFNGSPTRVNGWLYFTLSSGLVYVLDASAESFDGRAFLALNDLGPPDAVWSANSISYSNGRLFHRSAAELVCIGYRPAGTAADEAR